MMTISPQDKRKQLERKLLDLAFEKIELSSVSALLLSTLIVVALWPIIEHERLLVWLGAMAIIQTLILFYARRYKSARSVESELHEWRAGLVAGGVAAGLCWGSTVFGFPSTPFNPETVLGIFVLPSTPFDPVTVLLMFILAGVAAYASVAMAFVPSFAMLFLACTLLPLSIWLLSFGEHVHVTMSMISFSYFFIMVLLSRRMHATVCSLISVSEENRGLRTAQQESDWRMQQFFESAPGFFYTASITPAGKSSMPFVSAGIHELFDLASGEVADSMSPLFALVHAEDIERIVNAREASRKNLSRFRIEFRINHRVKGERWIELHSLPQREPDGSTNWHGFMQDITGRKRMEGELQRREAQFRTLAENAPDPIYRYDRDCRRVYINPSVATLTGVPLEKMLGKSPNEFVPVPTVDSDKVQCSIQRVLDTGMPGELEVAFRAADGRDVVIHNNLVPEFDSAGTVESVLCIGRDITARKRMEAVLQRSEVEFRTLAENLPVAVIRYDAGQRRRYLNPAAERMLHGSAAELLGNVPGGAMVPATPVMIEHYRGKMEEVLTSGVACEFEFVLDALPVAEREYYEVRFTPELGADGKPGGVLAIWYDFTGRKLMEVALQDSEDRYRHNSNLLQSIFESPSKMGIYALDREYRYLAFNSQFYAGAKRLWNVDITVGMSMLDAIDSDAHREICRQGFARVLDGHSFSLETKEAVLKDGVTTYEYHENFGAPIRNDNGEIIGLTIFTTEISARKAIENALHDSEKMLQEAQRIAHVGSWDVDMVNDKLIWSDEIFRIWEIDKTKFKADFAAFLETVHPEDRELVSQAYNEAVINHSLYEVEHRLLFPDGRIKHILERGEPQYDEQGKPVRFIGTSLDITERKRMEEVLAARERDFRSLAENMPDNVARWDLEGRYLYLNPVHERSLGLSAQDVLGKSLSEIFGETHFNNAPSGFTLAITTGKPALVERFAMPGENGETRFHDIQSVPEFDADGRIVSVLGIGRDMTDIYRMQDELAERERDFRSLAENLPDNIARWDVEGRYLYINPTHERLLGVAASEVIGTQLTDTHAHVKAALAQVVASGQAVELVRQTVPVNGELQTHEVSLVPEFDATGHVVSVLGLGRNMTEFYRLRDEIAAREQELRALAESSPGMMGAFYSRPDGSICMPYVSSKIEELFGLLPQDVVNDATPLLARNHPDDAQRVGESIAKSARTMTIWHEEYRIVHPTKGVRWMESNTSPEPHPDGGIVWYGYVHDITERKQVQQQLELLDRAIDMSADAVYLMNEQLRLIYVNGTACRVLGYSREELLAMDVCDIDQDVPREVVVKIIKESPLGVASTIETRHRAKDGRIFPVEISGVQFEEGGARFALTVARDITARKRLETKLREQSELQQTLLDALRDANIQLMMIEEGRVVYVGNRKLAYGMGYNDDEIDAHPPLLAIIHPDDRERVGENYRRRLAGEAVPERYELGLATRDGKRIEYETSVAVVPGSDPVRVVTVGWNITERKRMEGALKFVAQGEWLSGEEFLHALVRYLGEALGIEYVVIDRLSADQMYAETLSIYAKGEIVPNMQYGLHGTPCGKVMSGKACSYPDGVQGLFPEAGVLAAMQARSYVGLPLRDVEGRVIGLIAALDGQAMTDTNPVMAMLQLVAASAAAELVRSRMEGAMRESHESLAEAQRIAQVGNWELNLVSGALIWSEETYRIFEIDQTQFDASYEVFLNAIHPADREAVNRAYNESLENRLPYEIEHRLLFADGRIKYVEEHCETYFAGDGKPLYSVGTVQDISERKQAELALRANEEKLGTLFALSPLGIALTDMQGNYVEFNEAFRAICGYPTDELMILDYWALTPRKYEVQEAEQLESLAKTGRYGPYEKEYRQKDGTLIQIQLNGMLVTGKDGQQYIWSIVEDIRERRKSEAELIERLKRIAELNRHLEQNACDLEEQAVELEMSKEQLQQTEAWYRSILHSAPDGMLVVDSRGYIMQVNAQLEAMFGYEGGELPGCSIEVLLPQAARAAHVDKRASFISGTQRDRRMAGAAKDLFGCRKDGSEFPVDVSLSRLPDLDGREGTICAAVRDVTERQKADVARESALAEALRLAQLRSSFLAQMSHELRTPLNGILGYTQNLLRGEALGENQRSGLKIIQHSGEHLLTLINGILDHAAIEADKFELIPGDIELESFLSTIISIIRVRVEQKNIAFSCDAGDDLPAIVRGDAQRLRQVLLNLLSNAVKFTDNGQVILRVTYSAPSRLRFVVQDSGVGITADQLNSIFLPFEQVGETSRRAGGTGLGLAISRKLVGLMGGSINVESLPGAGSVFSFEVEMPAVQSDAAKVNAAVLYERAATRSLPLMPLLLAPPPQELDILQGLALRGNMRDVARQATRLAELDPCYEPFAEHLRQLARGFQTKALLGFIAQYRNEKECE